MDIKTLLSQVQSGVLTLEEAEVQLKQLHYQSLGDFAKLDHHRKFRNGFPEVIFCSGKSQEHLLAIVKSYESRGEDMLGTRCSLAQFQSIQAEIDHAIYDPVSGILKLQRSPQPLCGSIAICTGGTSDIPVAEEAAQTAEFFGGKVHRFYDVGVAGIHRLFDQIETIRHANCIIAVAGMEGALPGVLAGLVEKPVIAVPTSVGYGANFQGLAPLLTMLNSCAEGITVVNIDNGFGAAYSACQINQLVLGQL